MSLHGYATKRDKIETEVIKYLRGIGASVQQLSIKGCPDLLIGITLTDGTKVNALVEVKNDLTCKLTSDQKKWHGDWKGQVLTIYSKKDIENFIEQLNS